MTFHVARPARRFVPAVLSFLALEPRRRKRSLRSPIARWTSLRSAGSRWTSSTTTQAPGVAGVFVRCGYASRQRFSRMSA